MWRRKAGNEEKKCIFHQLPKRASKDSRWEDVGVIKSTNVHMATPSCDIHLSIAWICVDWNNSRPPQICDGLIRPCSHPEMRDNQSSLFLDLNENCVHCESMPRVSGEHPHTNCLTFLSSNNSRMTCICSFVRVYYSSTLCFNFDYCTAYNGQLASLCRSYVTHF